MYVEDRAMMQEPHRGGASRRESGTPERTCVVTRETHPTDVLLRFVVDPSGTIVPDIDLKLPGKGFWLLARRDIVRTARERNAFSKAARAAVSCPDDLDDRVANLLARRCLDLIGMARRAGEALCGFEKVRAALAADRVGVLVTAADGSADGKRKLGILPPGLVTVDLLDGLELGSVFGRDRVVHAAIAKGRICDRLSMQARRLAGFRDQGQVGKLN